MTEKLYDMDSHLKEFTATVISCEKNNKNYSVALDRTAFFPEGGGQPSDVGFIDGVRVLDVRITETEIHHITEEALQVGNVVECVLDWNRRFDFMQQHSGEHIVSGVAHSLFGCENVGFHLGEDIVTLDFDKPLSREQISQIEQISNQKVFQNLKFNTYYPAKELLKTLVFRSKREIDGEIRIVDIEDTDSCACCAPHVKTSGEIGIIKLLDFERLRGGVRIELKCGKRALEDYDVKYRNTQKISAMLCVKQNETADAVSKLLNSFSTAKSEITELKHRLIFEKTENFKTEKVITAEFEDGFDIKELQIYCDLLYKKHAGIRAVFSKCEDGFKFAACSDEETLKVWFEDFKQSFCVKGGGRNGMVQGTVNASKDEILCFFNA